MNFLARVRGKIVSAFPTVKYSPVNYRALANDKIIVVEICKESFDYLISDDAMRT